MELLEKIGLTRNESNVYLTLLDLGPSLAGQIARKSGLHRRTVYDTTEMLIQKGLISYIVQNNRRTFSAVDPQRILDILDEKKKDISKEVEMLKGKFKSQAKKQETNFYKGKNGLKMVFESQLDYPEILILGATRDAYESMPYYFKWYNERRKEKKVKIKIITSDKSIHPKMMAETRYLPEKYADKMVINIYGNSVAMILWGPKPFAVVVEQEEFASSYRKYFELMWKVAKAS